MKRNEPVTRDGERPQKKFYRQRAHCNPLSHNDSFAYPVSPRHWSWSEHFPNLPESSLPTVLDVGCGFGGLIMALGKILPKDEVILGLEIRCKVTEYVRLRIANARKQPGEYENCSVLRSNSMKLLPNFFDGASLNKLFFCFPDPHFKKKNHPVGKASKRSLFSHHFVTQRRIISESLLSEYAFLLKPGSGRLYCITDVKELHEWHVEKCDAHPMFRAVADCESDPCVQAMINETEEGKKVARNKGDKYYAVYQRIDDSEIPGATWCNNSTRQKL